MKQQLLHRKQQHRLLRSSQPDRDMVALRYFRLIAQKKRPVR